MTAFTVHDFLKSPDSLTHSVHIHKNILSLMEFSIRDTRTMLLSVWKFRENRRREGLAFLMGVFDIAVRLVL
jgi:hypothetical protein